MGKARVTMEDVAKAAGVGVATVDRVLNGRARVRKSTAEQVLHAAEQLGYHGHALLKRRIEEQAPRVRLGFILQKERKPFYQKLTAELNRAVGELNQVRASVHIRYVDALSPSDLSATISEMSRHVDAMAIVAIEHPTVSKAIDAAVKRGCPVYAILGPLTNPLISGFYGIDGRKAGRTAGWAMALHVPEGEVGILVGSHRYLGHEALETGFRSYMREHAPHLQIRDSVVYLDDAAVAFEAVSTLLRRSPDLAGLYHCGGGVSGALRALEESGRAGKLTYICHGLSPITERALVEGKIAMVIATEVANLANDLTRAMETKLIGGTAMPAALQKFQIVTPENV